MKISLIVAHCKNFGIGYNNDIPWDVKEDLQKFKSLTLNHHILMGRKTFESIGKPLPQRKSIVISRSNFDVSKYKDVSVVNTFDEAIKIARDLGETELFIIGGAQIYNSFIEKADILYISEIDYEGPTDAFLNPIKYDDYLMVEKEYYPPTESSLPWEFKKLIKNN